MPVSTLGVKPTNLSETLKSVKCNIALPNSLWKIKMAACH